MVRIVNVNNPNVTKDVPDYLARDYIATKEWLLYNEDLEKKKKAEKPVKKESVLEKSE